MNVKTETGELFELSRLCVVAISLKIVTLD